MCFAPLLDVHIKLSQHLNNRNKDDNIFIFKSLNCICSIIFALCFEKSYGVKWMNSIALIIHQYNSCVQKFNSWCPLTWWGRVQVRPSMRPANMWLLAWNVRHHPHGGCHSVIHDPPQEQMSSGSLSSPVIRPLLTPGEKCGQRIFCFSLPQYLFKVCDTWSLVRVCPLWLMR